MVLPTSLTKFRLGQRIAPTSKRLLKYLRDPNFRRLTRYAHLVRSGRPLDEHAILYESFHGSLISCNPAALCKQLLDDPKYSGFTHIWAVRADTEIPSWAEDNPRIKFIRVHSREYLKALATCKYLVNNTTFPPYFQRLDGQVYVNTWHGTPLKTLGKDMRGAIGQHKNIQRNFLHVTHFVSPNEFTSRKFLESHSIDGLFEGEIVEAGSPRIDATLSREVAETLRAKLGVPSGKKIVFYAPTWRGEVGQATLDIERTQEVISRLESDLGTEYHLLVRVHPLVRSAVASSSLSHVLAPDEWDTNELLAVADLLITDYSSVFFDYLPRRKPVIYHAYDLASYQRSRGLYLDMSELPGKLVRDDDALIEAIHSVDEWWPNEEQKLEAALAAYAPYDDGKSAARIVDIIFGNTSPPQYVRRIHDPRTRVLMYCGGWLNNGITTSAINLLNNIDYSKYQIVIIDKANYDEESRANHDRINENVKVFYRVGQMTSTINELVDQELFMDDPEQSDLYPREMYEREFRRMFGKTRFDVAIDFSGYVKFWAAQIAASGARKRVIYQHNQMDKEYDKIISGRYKHRKNLDVIFRLYKEFDTIACVSNETMKANIAALSEFMAPCSCVVINNCIDLEGIRAMASAGDKAVIDGKQYFVISQTSQSFDAVSMQGFPLVNGDTFSFVSIGRLSPEKNPRRLLEAFAQVVAQAENVHLYIVGDGVLRNEVIHLIEAHGLSSKVSMLGHLPNPMPLLKRADALVLSSDHEGQPMVLLEALTLGLPIVATDIPGSRDVLEGRSALLVEPDADALAAGMLKACKGEVQADDFDAAAYVERAVEMFYRNAIGDAAAYDESPG